MKVLVAVPSFRRPYAIQSQALRWLKKLTHDWVVCVEPREFIHYSTVVPRKNLIVSSNECFITGQMNRIGEYAREKGYDLVMKTDDESSFSSLAGNGMKMTGVHDTAQVVDTHLPRIAEAFVAYEALGVVGILRHREFYSNASKNYYAWVSKNRLVQGAYILRPEHLILPTQTKVLDDLIVGLQAVVDRGQEVLHYGRLQFNYRIGNNTGGMQTWGSEGRTRLEDETVAYLSGRYEGIEHYQSDAGHMVTKNPLHLKGCPLGADFLLNQS